MSKGELIVHLEEELRKFTSLEEIEYHGRIAPDWHYRYTEVLAGLSQAIIRSITDRPTGV